jgi:hypothetical protein
MDVQEKIDILIKAGLCRDTSKLVFDTARRQFEENREAFFRAMTMQGRVKRDEQGRLRMQNGDSLFSTLLPVFCSKLLYYSSVCAQCNKRLALMRIQEFAYGINAHDGSESTGLQPKLPRTHCNLLYYELEFLILAKSLWIQLGEGCDPKIPTEETYDDWLSEWIFSRGEMQGEEYHTFFYTQCIGNSLHGHMDKEDIERERLELQRIFLGGN